MVTKTRRVTVLRSTNEIVQMLSLKNVGTHYACPYCSMSYPQMRVTSEGRLPLPWALRRGLVSRRCGACGGTWDVPVAVADAEVA